MKIRCEPPPESVKTVKKLQTILYAEDDAVTLTAYKNRLEQAGYRVNTAADGLEALKLLHQSVPDLLLLDLLLPKFTGEEVLKYVSRNPALNRMPVIVLSSNSILDEASADLMGKAEKHLLKHTCTFPMLLAAIQELLAEDQLAVNGVAVRDNAGSQLLVENAAVTGTDADPLLKEIKEMQERAPVVCAWTDRINIEGKWMNLTEFLSERLRLKVSHGISPEGARQLLGGR
jgi:CheY-like chemotaxis protein